MELSIHDLLGRVLARPVVDMQPAGRYEVPFDAHGLAAGAHFVRLQVHGRSDTRKIVYVR